MKNYKMKNTDYLFCVLESISYFIIFHFSFFFIYFFNSSRALVSAASVMFSPLSIWAIS